MQSVVSASGGPIDETIRIRDLHQFEIKLHYPLSRESAVATYDLECYIFVPHSLGMHSANYSKARFYDAGIGDFGTSASRDRLLLAESYRSR